MLVKLKKAAICSKLRVEAEVRGWDYEGQAEVEVALCACLSVCAPTSLWVRQS